MKLSSLVLKGYLGKAGSISQGIIENNEIFRIVFLILHNIIQYTGVFINRPVNGNIFERLFLVQLA